MNPVAGSVSRPAVFALVVWLVVLVIITFYGMVSTPPPKSPNDLSATSTSSTNKKDQIMQIRAIVALVVFSLTVFNLPSLREIRNLAFHTKSVLPAVTFVIGLLLWFLFIPRSYIDKFYYVWNPLIIVLGAAVFLRGVVETPPTDSKTNSDTNSTTFRVRSLFLLLSYLTGILTFFLVRPGGDNAKFYVGTPLLLTVLIGFFGLLYVVLWATLPGTNLQTNSTSPMSFLTTYSGVLWTGVLSVFAIMVGTAPYFTQNTVTIASVVLYAFLASLLWAASVGVSLPKTINTLEFEKKQMAWLALFAVVAFSLGIYWIVYSVSHLTGLGSYLAFFLNIVVLFALVGYMYRTVRENSPTVKPREPSPLHVLLTESVFYLPCLALDIVKWVTEWARSEQKSFRLSWLAAIVASVAAFVVYAWSSPLLNQINTQGGAQLIREPQYIDTPTLLGTYASLNPDPDTYLYRNALSFWVFIDANAPTTVSADKEFANLVTFGNNPSIGYRTSDRMFQITIKKGVNENRVVYETHDFPLQRWNHVVVNNFGGTMDIFINNELVCSESEIVPYHMLDAVVVGQSDGINGGICNLVYFTHSLDQLQLYFLHNLVQWKSPPVFGSTNVSINDEVNG